MNSPSQSPRPSIFEQQLRARQKRMARIMSGAGALAAVVVAVALWLALRPADASHPASTATGALQPAARSEQGATAPAPAASAPEPTAPPSAVAPSSPVPPAAPVAADASALQPGAVVGGVPKTGAAAATGTVSANRGAPGVARPGTAARGPAAPTKSDGLTAEQRALLDRMGAGEATGPGPRSGATDAKPAPKSSPGLSAAQLSAVVARGRPTLQRCYETALRGSGAEQAVRTDISIAVSAAGKVTRVSMTGANLPGMEACIARSVRQWQFPTASEATETKFPIVFQPGS